MAKTANLYVRIEPGVKKRVEKIFASLGISASDAIAQLYKQIISRRGLPFELKLPAEDDDPLALTREEIDAKLKKSRDDFLAGKTTTMSLEEFRERFEKKMDSMKEEYSMPETANLSVWIEPEVKEEAEEILTALGVSNAVYLFYRQVFLWQDIPFEIELPADVRPRRT